MLLSKDSVACKTLKGLRTWLSGSKCSEIGNLSSNAKHSTQKLGMVGHGTPALVGRQEAPGCLLASQPSSVSFCLSKKLSQNLRREVIEEDSGVMLWPPDVRD